MSWIPSYKKPGGGGGSVPSWSTGTDEEIVAALTAHYNGEIDLTEYWSVGDERIVSLSAITDTTYVTETQPAQDVTFVIVNIGGKELVTPINGHTECAFVVGVKGLLYNTGVIYKTTPYNDTGWYSSNRRNWCNNSFYNSIPSTLQPIFKMHNNYALNVYNASSITKSEDYFCLPSGIELGVGGTSTDATYNTLFGYYETSANRLKMREGEASSSSYWTSTKMWSSSKNYQMLLVSPDGISSSGRDNTSLGISPQGVI